ncbi:alpha-2,8-sialyltransferase 8F-like [Saccoglossus kowalevskii]|uniref:Alpha-2,8-sialyltransferase 8F-like n=1 Tax=Saccoglossus kowalevskii TaxID=10224 RepID=A0ABM0MBK6_SACKO|nr:PREDICTED: alpha-2,8-sialyltransferase 8F-like [Saccoglossus kowalevskii]
MARPRLLCRIDRIKKAASLLAVCLFVSVVCVATVTYAHEFNITSFAEVKMKTTQSHRTNGYVIRQRNLQNILVETKNELRRWCPNKTRTAQIRDHLNRLTQSNLIISQGNTPTGRRYYNTFYTQPVRIDEAKRNLLPVMAPFSEKSLYISCAVIGNGGILKHSGCGKEIDRFEFILRSNLPVIGAFTHDVGSKTNLTSLNPSVIKNRFHYLNSSEMTSMFLNALDEYSGYLLWIHNSRIVDTSMAFRIAQLVKENTTLQILLTNAEFLGNIEYWWKSGKTLSTGMLLTSIGLMLCEEVHLYGFWPFSINSEGMSLPMHYTEDLNWSTYHQSHDYPTEFKILTQLHLEGVLHMHVDEPCS